MNQIQSISNRYAERQSQNPEEYSPLYDLMEYEDYAQALEDVDDIQSALILSSQGLSTAQIQQTLAAKNLGVEETYLAMEKAGLLSSEISLTSAEAASAAQRLISADVLTAEAAAELGLITAEGAEIGTSVNLTSAKLQQAIANGTLTKENAQLIASIIGVTIAEETQTKAVLPNMIATMNALALKIKEQIILNGKWMLSLAANPMTWVVAGIAAVGVCLAAMNKSRTTTKDLIKENEQLKTKYSDLQSEIEEIDSLLDSNNKKIKELTSLENPTYVDQQDLQDLREQNALLEYNKKLNEEQQKETAKKQNENADQLAYDTYFTTDGLKKDAIQLNSIDDLWNNQKRAKKANRATADVTQVTQTVEMLEQLKSSYDVSHDPEEAKWIEELENKLSTERSKVLDLLSNYSESDPEIGSTMRNLLLSELDRIDKSLNTDEWMSYTFDKIYNSGSYADISQAINDKLARGEKITYDDLINDSTYEKMIKKISLTFYNAADDESLKKAASYLSDKVSGFVENGDVKLLIPFDEAFSNLAEETKNNLFDLATAGELSAETIHSTEEYQAILDATGISAEELINTITKLNFVEKETTINELNNILTKLQAGTSLTKAEISKLVAENSDLADSIKITGDGYSLEESAINSLINSNIKLYNEAVANEIQRTKTTIEQSNTRIEAIKNEIESVRNLHSTLKPESFLFGTAAEKNVFSNELLYPDEKIYSDDMLKADEMAIQKLNDEINALLSKNKELEEYLNTLNFKEESVINDIETPDTIAADTSFNWIETRITRLQRHFQNMVDSVTGYVSTHFKLNKMDEELRSLDEQISAYQSAEAFYFQKAYNIPLADDFRQKVINGEISVQTLNNESLVNAVNEFKEWYEKYLDAIDQKVKLTNDRQAKIREKMDIQATFHQTRQNRLSAATERLNDTIDNRTSRGKFVNTAYYQQLIQNAEQQIAEYTAEKNLWQNYLSTLEQTSDEYEGVMDSIEGIDSSIRSCIADQLEWKKTIAETDYNRLVSKYESLETKSSSRTGKIDYLESIGGFGSKSDYNALIRLNGKQIQNLYAQNTELEKLRKNCDAGTDLWKEYTKNIQDNNSSILELTRSTAEYAETLYQLPIEKAAAKTELLQKDFDLLEKKMEYADSYTSKNKYLDKENSNEYRQLTAYREASVAAGKSFYGIKSNLLKQINFQSLNGNDIRILQQCIKNGTTIPASIIAKMDSSSAARANKYNASLKAKNEAEYNYESYRYDYIGNKKSRGEQKLENINNYYDTELTKWTDEANLYNAKISLKEKLGVTQSRTDYNRLITNSKKQENLLKHQHSALYTQIQKNLTSGVWSYDSEEYKKAKSTLSGIDEKILKAKTDQLEWNNAIQSIPLNTIEKLSSVLNLVKSELEGLMDLAEKHGNAASPSSLKKLIFQSVSSADQAQESIKLYTETINKKLTNGDWAKLTEKQLAKVWKYIEAGDISRLKNYFTYTLNIDPATLEEFFSDIDKIADETDKKFQAEIKAEEYLDRFFDLYIDKLNEVKEKLSEINDARQKALELEKLEAQLQKAKDNKTISIYREGIGMVYEADQNAIKEAQDSLDNYYYEQMIDHLDKISEILEELKETFNIYTDNGTLKTDYESIIAEALKTASGLYSEGLNSIGGSSGSFDFYNNLMQLGGLPASLQKQNLADMADRMRNSISAISSAAGNKITNISLKLDNVSLPNIKSGQDAEKFIQELKRISLDALQYANKK